MGHSLGPALQLRLLAALVNDVANSAPLRRTLAGREAALASLATDRQKEVLLPLRPLVSYPHPLHPHPHFLTALYTALHTALLNIILLLVYPPFSTFFSRQLLSSDDGLGICACHQVTEEKRAAKERVAALREEERLVRETASGPPRLPLELQVHCCASRLCSRPFARAAWHIKLISLLSEPAFRGGFRFPLETV